MKLVDRRHAHGCGGRYLPGGGLSSCPTNAFDGTSTEHETNDAEDARLKHRDLPILRVERAKVCRRAAAQGSGASRMIDRSRAAGSPRWTFPVAKLLDYVAAGDGVKFDRVHILVRNDVVAKLGVVGVQHMLRGPRQDCPRVHGVAGMKQQGRAALDTDVPDAEKQRAGRLAASLNSKRLTRLIVLLDDRVETRRRTSIAVAGG